MYIYPYIGDIMAFYTVENDLFARTLEVNASGVRSTSMLDKRNHTEYLSSPSREFFFSINDRMFSSWQSASIRLVDGNTEISDSAPQFIRAEKKHSSLSLFFALDNTEVTLTYLTYPGICGYRKHITIKNLSPQIIKINKLAFDDTCACPGKFADCQFFTGFNEAQQPVCFTCEGNEDIIRCHNSRNHSGWIMGSDAPGILRYQMIYPVWHNAVNALNMSSAPFAVYLKPGESFQSPDSIFSLYGSTPDDPDGYREFQLLIRQNLPPLPQNESLMYCTWFPFMKNINATLILDLIDRAADIGFGCFVLDDGWFTMDDHQVDKNKFPGGLEEISTQVRKHGMTFGLWLNVGTDYGLKAPKDEWFAKQYDGKISRLGFDYSNSGNVLCMGSTYRDFLLDTLIDLTQKYQVGYFKLDFSSVMSPYGLLPYGCHAKNHRHHHGWDDSFAAIYDGMTFLKNEMYARFPDLILDFSFEAFGTEKPNIAALELSPLHHVSNISAENPDIQSLPQVRNCFYQWLKKFPPERILNGLIAVNHNSCAEALLTAFSGAPLAAGDLRTLDDNETALLKSFAQAFNRAAANGHMTDFHEFQNLPDGVDGFKRTNRYGNGFAAFFNHSQETFTFDFPQNCRITNVETNENFISIPPGKCAMFLIGNF